MKCVWVMRVILSQSNKMRLPTGSRGFNRGGWNNSACAEDGVATVVR